jgi:hypothetical protein
MNWFKMITTKADPRSLLTPALTNSDNVIPLWNLASAYTALHNEHLEFVGNFHIALPRFSVNWLETVENVYRAALRYATL